MAAPALGVQAALGMGGNLPVNEAYEFLQESLRAHKTILDSSGIRGTRSHTRERTRQGTYAVRGQLRLHPAPEELANLLPRILGAAASGTTYSLAELIPKFHIAVDRKTAVFTYSGCKVVRATFRGAQGLPLELLLDIEGETETVAAAGSFPAITPVASSMYTFMDGTISLLGAARAMKAVEIQIENVTETDRFLNSITRADIPVIDRMVRLRCVTPYSADEADLYNQAVLGAAASVTFTNGGYSTLFSFGNVQFPAQSPVVEGRGEVVLTLDGIARKAGSTPELTVTHDSTP